MSSTGVRESNDTNKRIIKGLIQNEAQFIQSLRVFANTSTLSGLGSTEGEINNSPRDPSGNYLSRLGDKMLGPLALSPPLDFTIEIDANNTIDIGPLNDNAQYTSNVQLDSIQPNSFVLDIIANAAFDGQLLFLRTFAPTIPFTISQGTLGNGGNIQTGDGNDLTVGDLQIVTLIFDEALKIEANTGGSWRVLSVSSGSGGSSSVEFPIDFPELDMGSPTVSTDIDYNNDTRHFRKIELSDDLQVNLLNIPVGTSALCTIYFTQNGVGGHTPFLPDIVNPNEIINNIDLSPNATTIFTIQSAFGVNIGFVAGKNIFFGSSGEDWSTFPAIQTVNLADNSIINALGISFLPISGANSSLAPTVEGLNILSGTNRAIILSEDGVTNFAKFDDSGTDFLQNEIRGITSIDMDGAFATIQGVANINFIQASHDINSLPSGLLYQVDTGQDHLFFVGGVTKFEIQPTSIKSFVALNMNNQEVNLVSDIAFGTAILLNTAENAIGFSSIHGLQYNTALTSEPHTFTAAGELLATITRVGSNQGQISTHSVVGNILHAQERLFLSSFINSTPVNGDIWRDSGDGNFKFRQNGITEELGGITNQISQNDSNVTVTDVGSGNVTIVIDGIPKASITSTLFSIDDSVKLGLTSTDDITFTGRITTSIIPRDQNIENLGESTHQWNELHVDSIHNSTNIRISSPLLFDDLSVNPLQDGELTRNGTVVALQTPEFVVRRDSIVVNAEPAEISIRKLADSITSGTTVATLNFQSGISSPVTWSDISSGPLVGSGTDAGFMTFFIRADNSLINAFSIQGNDNDGDVMFLFGANDPVRLQPLLQPMGYFVTPQVTDFSLNLGTSGSLECPRINDGNPSVNDLNQAGGAFNTSLFVHDIADGALYVKNSNTQWDVYARTGTVT